MLPSAKRKRAAARQDTWTCMRLEGMSVCTGFVFGGNGNELSKVFVVLGFVLRLIVWLDSSGSGRTRERFSAPAECLMCGFGTLSAVEHVRGMNHGLELGTFSGLPSRLLLSGPFV